MPQPTQTDITRLLTEVVIPFHCIERNNDLPKTGRWENDAEHSWSTAI